MKLLDSLLDAIVRLEGDALVMHVGEKPYVVTASSSMNAYRGPLAWGQVELSSRVLTFDAVSSMLVQILPDHQQQALTEFGAIEHEIPSPTGVAGRFTVIAARGGEDVWLEVRRRPIEIEAESPEAVPPAELPAELPAAHLSVPPATASEPDVAPVHSVPVASETIAVDESPAVAYADEPPAEPAPHTEHAPYTEHEIELVGEEESLVDSQAVPDVLPEDIESIVVAIPGQEPEEIQLDGVPDNAIQIIDDEAQGVPTEEEVDAMLAATATALLTSGLGDDVVESEGLIELQAPAREDESEETPIVLNIEVAAVAVDIDVSLAEPGFELSPPPPLARADDDESEDAEVIADTPLGTPLFSDDAVLAAAAAPVPEAAIEEAPIEHVSVVGDVPTVEGTAVVEAIATAEAPVELVPSVEQTLPIEHPPAAETWSPSDTAPIVETWPVAEHAPIGQTWPVADQTAIVETWPLADQAPVADNWPMADQTPIVETWAVADHSAIVETWPMADHAPIAETWPAAEQTLTSLAQTWSLADQASIVGTWPVADQAPIAEIAPVADHFPIATAPTAAEVPVAEVPAAVVEPSNVESPSVVEVGAELPEGEQATSPWPEDTRPVVDEIAADVMSVLNAGAEQAVSEPTPQEWTPSAAEMPMEVTPELRQPEPIAEVADPTAASPETPRHERHEPVPHAEAPAQEDETRQAVVVPLARTHIKPESVSVPFTPSEDAALMHTLRVAAARGASTVYVVAQSKPMIRIDGEIGPLESEPTLTAADVDRLVMELAPPRRRDALQNGPVEWLCDVPEIGRVRCLTFRDHRGPGILFRMFPPRAISADQLGLTPEVQALCQQSDGLVLVTGARASGKSTLLNAFVDLINRTRSDHLITIESQIGFVHESRRSFISQRESRGDAELAATYARAALREDPDVMMIEDLKSADLVSAALEAAESGRLVLASVPASSTIGALERLIEVFPADRRAKARTSLASALRGVVAQVLLRRIKGGRVAAREILLNTPAVSTLVLEGKMFQLPVALDSGRRHGMVPLTDSLAAQVRDGTVHVAEAYRKALDRAALVALLKREGIDTSFAERLA